MRLLTLPLLAVLAAPTGAAAAVIVPTDGTWTVTPRDSSVGEGCPAEMTDALRSMAAEMSRGSSFNVTWNGPFDPNAAEIDGGDDGVEWTQVDDQTWDGEMKASPEAPTVGTMRMRITGPGTIDSTTTVAVGALMAAQGQDVPALETCEIELVSEMAHAG